jgi:small subunit ribosomal protein S6
LRLPAGWADGSGAAPSNHRGPYREAIFGQLYCGIRLKYLPLQPKSIFLSKNREMNNYELMVIFTPVLSEEDYKASQKKYSALVKENGGRVLHDNPWGLKSLAYAIQKKTTGLYWVLEYSAPSDFNEKLKIQLLRDEHVLRFMATRLDKYAVEYNAKRRSGVATGTEKVEA